MKFVGLSIRIFISISIAIISAVAPGLMGDMIAPDSQLDPQECKLNFAAISDLHIQTEEYSKYISDFIDLAFAAIMPGFKKFDQKLDALVLTGDITEHGYVSQWQKTESILTSSDYADNIILAAGNHDLWTRGEQGRTSEDLFKEYNKKITGRETDKMYYSTEVKGYTFIILCSESDSVGANFGDAQMEWFKAELAKAAEKDLPIFVISHWPLNKTHGLPQSFGDAEYDDMTGGIGARSDEVEEALKAYDNVFLLSGHIHTTLSNAETEAELGYRSIESDGSFHSINLPRVSFLSQNGYHWLGSGYNVEVYEDKVVFRARNYISDNWLPEYDYVAELV